MRFRVRVSDGRSGALVVSSSPVALDRLDVSPVQAVAADELLLADPLGSQLLTVAVDPAAACLAAAH